MIWTGIKSARNGPGSKTHKAYQHNIKTSEALRAEILKGLASGENHAVILEKAIRCIGCMTDDKSSSAGRKDVKENCNMKHEFNHGQQT